MTSGASAKDINELKQSTENVAKMVEEKEQLALKLESEIAQWYPSDKLLRRNEELEYIQKECVSNSYFIKTEQDVANGLMSTLESETDQGDGTFTKKTVN